MFKDNIIKLHYITKNIVPGDYPHHLQLEYCLSLLHQRTVKLVLRCLDDMSGRYDFD